MNYNVFIADEAIDDIWNLVRYIRNRLYNPSAAEKLYNNLKSEVKDLGTFPYMYSDVGILYKGYVIHKKVYQSYLIFYVIDDDKREVYVLKVLKDLMDWKAILNQMKNYSFSNSRKNIEVNAINEKVKQIFACLTFLIIICF